MPYTLIKTTMLTLPKRISLFKCIKSISHIYIYIYPQVRPATNYIAIPWQNPGHSTNITADDANNSESSIRIS